MRSWVVEDAEPNADNVAKWNGRTSEGRWPPTASTSSASATRRRGVESTADSRFGFYKYRFPIRADMATGTASAPGAGTRARTCSPAAAPRWWRRAAAGCSGTRPRGAGNYLVIDGKRTKKDYMYAHMLAPSPLQRGRRVRTGQRIGQVGDSGNASGCHLHIEDWSGPGWYEGGHALSSVRRMLKTWDAWS